MALVLPGDVVHSPEQPLPTIPAPESTHLKLGPGLLPERLSASGSSITVPTLVATRAGILGHLHGRASASGKATGSSAAAAGAAAAEGGRTTKRPKIEDGKGSKGATARAQQDGLWVEANTRRYVPAPSDTVIGQITARGPDFYTVSLLSAHTAALPVLSFEGATKRHRPNIRVGALVYARVVGAERHTDPELGCVNPVTGKADGLGELKVAERETGCAMLFRISLGLASSLLHPSHPLLPRLAAHFPFESAIGHNGLLWARAAQPSHLIALGRVLERAEHVGFVWASSSSSSASSSGRRRRRRKAQQQGGVAKKDEDEDEGMAVDGEGGEEEEDEEDEVEALTSRAQDVARLRGALSKEEIKLLVGPFL
ncbi:exosome non-catalytic core subunit rrp40 [Tilletia horrida]|nr:exosome non-catalytic core subunit rrp40 [Tilletia horrida]